MTKELQKELKEKVKPGIKPSQLKRSRSTGDIPKAPLPHSTPLTKSKSANLTMRQELESPQVEKLETKISSLELKLEVGQRELGEVQAEKQLLAEQLKVKQREVEKLREQLETALQELISLKKEKSNLLDDNLTLKHQGLKEWFAQYQQTQKLEKELAENIDYASEELIEQDQRIASLKKENSQLKTQNQSLQKDLNLTQKLAQLRSEPLYSEPWPSFPWGWSLISLTLILLWIKNYD